MNYTLDSVIQFTESLKEQNKEKKINYLPVLIFDLNQIAVASSDIYFGILTTKNKVNLVYNGVPQLELGADSQIVDFFHNLSSIESLIGHFRGFRITMQ